MRSNDTTVRYVKVDSVLIGDTIKVETRDDDVIVTKTGTVAYRDYTLDGLCLYTSKQSLIAFIPRDDLIRPKITLLNRRLTGTRLF